MNPKIVANEFFDVGSSYMEIGQFNRAIDYFERAIELQPDATAARHNLVISLLKFEENEAAEIHLDYLLEIETENTKLLELQATFAQNQGRTGDAIVIYDSLLEMTPLHRAARYNKALLLWSVGENSLAEIELKNLLLQNSEDISALYSLGLLLLESNKFEAAAATMYVYIEKVPSDIDGLIMMAMIERQQGHYDEVLDIYNTIGLLLAPEDRRQASLAFRRAEILLTIVGDTVNGFAALQEAMVHGYRNRQQLTDLFNNRNLENDPLLLTLVQNYIPGFSPTPL